MNKRRFTLVAFGISMVAMFFSGCETNDAVMGSDVAANLEQMDEMLFLTSEMTKEKAALLIENTKAKVSDRGDKEKELDILDEMKAMHEEALDDLHMIDKIRGELIQSGALKYDVEDVDRVDQIMNEGDPTKSEEINRLMHKYRELLGEYKQELGDSIVVDQMEKERFRFKGTPSAVALPTLTQCRQRITWIHWMILSYKNSLIGASDFKFDWVGVGLIPERHRIRRGASYKAEAYLQARTSTVETTVRWKPLGSKEWENEKTDTSIVNLEFSVPEAAKPGKKELLVELEFMGPEGVVVLEDTFAYYVER